ncbi:MAG: respiratory nitrate reductase subunit gamma [Desulfocucumaceae bacterium]
MFYFILQILPYVTMVVFTFGLLYRLGRWAGSRIVHNITLSPFPQSNTQVLGIFGAELIFFRSLFMFDRPLWVGAWFMHIALFSVIGGHLVGIYFLGKQFVYLGMSEHLSEQMSALLGTSMGLLMFAGLIYLLVRRMSITKVKEVTGISDYLHLILLLTIVIIGNIMRLWEHDLGITYAPVKDYVTHLVMLQPIPANHEVFTRPFFGLHLLFVQILLMVFPFSKLMHVFGMFADRWIINRVYKDPAPGLPNVDVKAARAAGLGIPSGDSAA